MTGFFIKKAFYDGWDNMLSLLAVNALVLGIGFGGYFLAALASPVVPLSVLIVLVTVLLEGVILTASSVLAARVADYGAFSFGGFVEAVKSSWTHGALFAALVSAVLFVYAVALPWYFGMGGLLGFSLAVVMIWAGLFALLALQWFLPVRSRLSRGFVESLRKSFIIMFDNTGFSVFMLFYSVALLALSTVSIFLIPGVAGLILAQNEAFRLRMYKYDWLEEHPETDSYRARNAIPWDELLAGDRETVGRRSFKSFIFPWKD